MDMDTASEFLSEPLVKYHFGMNDRSFWARQSIVTKKIKTKKQKNKTKISNGEKPSKAIG